MKFIDIILSKWLVFFSIVGFAVVVITIFLYPGKLVPNQIIAVSENEVVILDCFYIKPGGKLLSIQKQKDGQWSLVQSTDLKKLGINRIPEKCVFNHQWLVITSDLVRDRNESVYFLKKKDNQWYFVEERHGDYRRGIDITDDNQLIINDAFIKRPGVVECYDLNYSSPKLVQTIEKPIEIASSDSHSFGTEIYVHEDTLLVKDSDATFTPEEEIRYGLKPEEKAFRVTPSQMQYSNRSTALMYGKKNGQWVFEADLYHLLPHPKGGAIRNRYGHLECFSYSFFNTKNTTLAGNDVYLRGSRCYYVFSKNRQGKWYFKQSLTPPFKLEDRIPEERGIRLFFEYITIGAKWTGRTFEDDKIEIYETKLLDSWKPRWTFHFVPTSVKNEILQITKNAAFGFKDLHIRGDVIVAEYNMKSAYDRKTLWWKVPTKRMVCIFEVDSENGPQEVFQLRAVGKKGLTSYLKTGQ